MNTFTYNSIPSSTYGIFIEHRPVQVFPKRIIESVSIPGRSGNFLIDTGAYDNVTMTYQVAYIHSGSVRADAINIATWLYQNQYCDLTDTYEPLYYRKAVYVSPLNVTDILNEAGRANITFDCKPQRYLLSGLTALTPASGSSITNDYQTAKPTITITGSGTGSVSIGASTIAITGQTDDIVMDCENMTAEENGANANSKLTITGGYPELVNGANLVTFSGGVTAISVVPNWWTL